MKTKITMALIALSFIANAQIQIIKTDTIVCPGDSIGVYFKWDNKKGSTNFTIAYPNLNAINSVDNDSFYSLEKTLSNGDTIYKLLLPTKIEYGTHRVTFGVNWVNKWTVDISCTWLGVGINEYTKDAERVIYFDLNGNKCEPKIGVILIKQVGGVRSKVLILD